MNNKISIRFEFCNGTLIEQDKTLEDNLWVHSIRIEIPSTDKKYASKGKALSKHLRNDGMWVLIDKYDKKSINLSLQLQDSRFTFSVDEFFESVDDSLEFIYPKLEKVNIKECVITLYGEINWHKRKCI